MSLGRIQAKELGFEHLGKKVVALSVTATAYELIRVTHGVHLSDFPTRDNPTPKLILDDPYTQLWCNGVAPFTIDPESMVMVVE